MKNLFQNAKEKLKNKRGMTFVELLVALSLLMLIIMMFTPLLLSSYDYLYQAGETNEKTYNSKSDIERKLSIRENDPLVEGGLAVSFRSFANTLVVKAKEVGSEVTGLNTLYGSGKVRIRILTDDHISDNQSYYSVVASLVNLDARTVVVGSSHQEGKIVVYVQSTVQKNVAIDYSVIPGSSMSDKIIIEIKNCDLTYAPFKIFLYYYDEYDKPRTSESYIYVSAADLMFVGKVGTGTDSGTSDDAQYITSAGADASGNLLLAGRLMYDDAIPSNSTINRVRWVTSESNDTLKAGSYIMVGDNSFIRRLWNLDATTGSVYTDVYDANAVAYINGTAYYKKTWGSDYTKVNKKGYNFGKDNVFQSDHSIDYADYDTSYYAETNAIKSVIVNNRINGGTNKLIPLSYVLTASQNEVANSTTRNGYWYSNGSSKLKLGTNSGSNSLDLTLNWQANDGKAGVSNLKDDYKSKYDGNTYCNALTLADMQALFSKNGLSYGNISGKNYVPVIFFSSNGEPSGINRIYTIRDNNYGAEIATYRYGTRYKTNVRWEYHKVLGGGWWSTESKWTDHHESGGEKSTFMYRNSFGTLQMTGCPPRDDCTDDIWNYYNEYKDTYHSQRPWDCCVNGDYYYDNYNVANYETYVYGKYIENNPWYNGTPENSVNPGWNATNWGSSKKDAGRHRCWICDTAANFCVSLPGYETQNQATVKQFLVDYFLNPSNKQEMQATSASFVGSSGEPSSDGEAAFIRLKSYTNALLTFDKVNSSERATKYKDSYKILFKECDALSDNKDARANANTAQVNLTDVAFIDSNTSGCVYTGITPAVAMVYTPYSSNAHQSTGASNKYKIFVIQSYGTDGYTIYQSKNSADHNDFYDKDASVLSNSSLIVKRGDHETASFTLGYASNRSLVYTDAILENSGSIDGGNLRNWTKTGTDANGKTVDLDNNLYYTSDFYTISTYTQYENYIFGAGYCVSGVANAESSAASYCTDSSHKLNNCVDMTDPNSLFTDSNFVRIKFKNGDSGGAAIQFTTLNNSGSQINTNSSNQDTGSTSNGFFFQLHAGSTEYKYIESYPYCAIGYTTLTKTDQADCEAVTNHGVLLYMSNGESSFKRINYSFSGVVAPKNFKFASVAVVKSKSNNKLDVAIASTNGVLYTGTLNTNDNGEITSNSITLTQAFCDLSYITSFKDVVFVESDSANCIIASGMQKSTGNTYMITLSGTTWRKQAVPGTSKFNIYDLQISGEYVYAAGANDNNTKGVVCYMKLSDFLASPSNNNWKSVKTYSTSFSSNKKGEIKGENGFDLPALYSCATKV